MGCFFACFRMKDSDRRKAHLVSKSIASRNRDPLVTKNQLASVFLREEKGSPSVKVKHLSLQQNFDRENADEELANEVKFLKSCSAQLETPVEIRKASEKTILQSPSNDGETSNSCSRLPDKSDHLSDTPTKINGSSVQPDGKPGSLSQMKELREDDPPGQSNDGEKSRQVSLMSSTEISSHDKEGAEFKQETPKLVVPSLSQWLKPPTSIEERWRAKSSDKSPAADRPIIGLVATHWNENEPTRVSPKWFDGNGIPNSTNKYQEDQKVSWHATPFEERLEKALSEEKLYPRRQLSGSPVNVDVEREESDTAASYA